MQVTAYHSTKRDALGFPDPYYVYDIIETPAPWIGPQARTATIVIVVGDASGNAPLPTPNRFSNNNGPPGSATVAAYNALVALPALHGLNFI